MNKEKASELFGTFASKKLAVLIGTGLFGDNVINSIKELGVSPDVAFVGVLILIAVYLVSQGIVDYKKEGVKGVLAGLRLRAKELEEAKQPVA